MTQRSQSWVPRGTGSARRSLARKLDDKGGPLAQAALDPHGPAVCGDDLSRDVQPQAEPAVVERHRALEALENALRVGGRDPNSTVAHRQECAGRVAGDGHLDGVAAAVFDRVAYQV